MSILSKKLLKEKSRILASFCLPGNVLDMGFAALPNPFLKDAVGVDIDLPPLSPQNYSQVIKSDLSKDPLPLPSNSFENVIAGDVIEHLENPSHFLREINKVLKKGGRLILSTPHANEWWTTLHNWFFRKWIKDPDGEHLQNWTILDMTRLLAKNGFAIEKIEGFLTRCPKIALRFRVKYPLFLSWQLFYIAKKINKE